MAAAAPATATWTRERLRREQEWVRNKRRILRNTGQAYESVSHDDEERRQIQAKDIGRSCGRALQGFDHRVVKEKRETVFRGFYNLGTDHLQNAYSVGYVKVLPTKRCHGRSDRCISKCTRLYYVRVEGQSVRVCQKELLSTHAVSYCRVNQALKVQEKNGGTSKRDLRGKHANRPNRISEESKYYTVRAHIDALPRCIPAINPNKEYLSPDLNISRISRLYVSKCEEEGHSPVKECAY